MLEIQFIKQKRTIQVEPGANLRESAIKEKLSIYPHVFKILNCRGRGLCTSCTLEIVSGEVDPPNEIEQEKLKSKLEKNPNLRLGCQVTVKGNLVVRTHV